MGGFYIPRGPYLATAFSFESRCEAITQLVRPDEVAHLWQARSPDSGTLPASAPAEVAGYLDRELASGRMYSCSDPNACNRWCSPTLTLEQGRGDCDDLSILACSLVEAAALEAWVVVGEVNTRDLGTVSHGWVEGHDELGRGYLLEATTGSLYVGRPDWYSAQMLVNERGISRVARKQKPIVPWLLGAAGLAGLVWATTKTDE